jgi:crotonobetainyl-CoA hydratase
MELLLTGRRMGADEAKQWGLVNAVVAEDQLMDKAREYAETIIQAAPLSVAPSKR